MKTCGECTVCCDGTLSANIYGNQMGKGVPCPFAISKKGCSIYENRPHDPCKTYQCAWLIDEKLPDYMRPDKCGVVVTYREKGSFNYMSVSSLFGTEMSTLTFSHWIQYAIRTGQNMVYVIQNDIFWVGSPEFVEFIEKLMNVNPKTQLT